MFNNYRLINLNIQNSTFLKKVLPGTIQLIGIFLCLLSFPHSSNAGSGGDRIYLNGKIYTMDSKRSWQEAFVIREGKFFAVGTNEEIRRYITDSAEVIDLKEHMVMPGIHDAHVHLEWAGIQLHHECPLFQVVGAEQIVSALKQCDVKRPGGWLTGRYYDSSVMDNALLNEAFPDTPILLWDVSTHNGLANAAALKLAGVDMDTLDPHGGRIVRDPVTGVPNGMLIELASTLVSRVIPYYEDDVYREALTWSINMFNKYGVTSVQEASASPHELSMLKELDENGELSLHVAAHLVMNNIKYADVSSEEELYKLVENRHQYDSRNVDTGFIKFWIDGVPFPPFITSSELDSEEGIEKDNLLVSESTLTKLLVEFDKQGMVVKMHVAGEGSARTALNAVEKMRSINGYSGVMHELVHCIFVDETDIKRMSALGVVAEMSPATWRKEDLNNDIFKNAYRFNTIQKYGVHITVGSDWFWPPSPNIFPALQGILEWGDEALDLESALAALTINGVKVVNQQQRMGSIEVGKDANFIMLDRNLFKVPAASIGETTVLQTVFEGKVVFQQEPALFVPAAK